jgi:carbon monoxide dehydrogenase subunit G
MAEVKVEQEIDASADRVWKLMRDFGGLKAWNQGIESVEVAGEGVGAIRTIKMGAITIKERLEHFDDAGRTFRYSIVEGPVPARDYLATVQVEEAGPDRARIVWGSSFEPQGASVADLTGLFEGIYKGGIAGLRKTLVS